MIIFQDKYDWLSRDFVIYRIIEKRFLQFNHLFKMFK
jgi:hypothetical protein